MELGLFHAQGDGIGHYGISVAVCDDAEHQVAVSAAFHGGGVGVLGVAGLGIILCAHNQYLEGQAYLDCSQETAAIVDKEVKALLERCYGDAKRILTENRGLLDEISEFLLAKETITGDELMAYVKAAQGPDPEEPAAEETAEE